MLVLGMLLFSRCTREDSFKQYEALLEKELSSGKRADSLFYGIYFGMTSKQFFGHCWEMNKKGLFTDGENNTAVLYRLHNNELQHPAAMNFYPKFYQDKVYKMQVTFTYDAWAPWNKHLFSDQLHQDVLNLYKRWYRQGNPFTAITDPEKGTIYVKLDGNRRITIGQYDEMRVKVDYTDVLVERQLK